MLEQLIFGNGRNTKREINLNLAGLTKDDLKIDYDGGYLTISVSTKFDSNELKAIYNGYSKTYYVGIIPEVIKANMEHGLLSIDLKETRKPTKVEFV